MDKCKQGHELSNANILVDWSRAKPTIRCRECRRVSAEKQSRRRGILKRGSQEYIKELFEKHFYKTETCWLWTGCLESKGYGRFGIPGTSKLAMAHRFSYELYKESIPEDLQLDHICEIKNCVNPDHLEPVTNEENQRRYWKRLRLKRTENQKASV